MPLRKKVFHEISWNKSIDNILKYEKADNYPLFYIGNRIQRSKAVGVRSDVFFDPGEKDSQISEGAFFGLMPGVVRVLTPILERVGRNTEVVVCNERV